MAKRKSVLIGDLLPFFSLAFSIIATILVIVLLFTPRDRGRKRVMSSQDTKILSEILNIKEILSERFGLDFDEEKFSRSDCLNSLFAIESALNRFNYELRHTESTKEIRMEARGYISALKILLNWADSNKQEGLKRDAEELLKEVQSIYKRVNRF